MKIDRNILTKAAFELHRHMGSLGDFPINLRNTIGSLYYEYWWFQITNDTSSETSNWTRNSAARISHYEMVPTLVKQMRETRREHELAFEMMVDVTHDLLRYDLKDVVRKSAARRAFEKAFKKPYYEVPDIYYLIEREIRKLDAEYSSLKKFNNRTRKSTNSQHEAEQPAIEFIGQLPHVEQNQAVRTFQYLGFLVRYYRNPKSYGEIVAGITSPYKYEHVAVIEENNEPVLIIRTEEPTIGEKHLCSLSRNGEHSNFGKFLHDDEENFLSMVVEKLSSDDFNRLE